LDQQGHGNDGDQNVGRLDDRQKKEILDGLISDKISERNEQV
jgi:hypothetical protein